jgi:proteic killer suppression protein
MDIAFATRKLGKELNESKLMIKAHGSVRTKKLQAALARLRAIEIEDTHG